MFELVQRRLKSRCRRSQLPSAENFEFAFIVQLRNLEFFAISIKQVYRRCTWGASLHSTHSARAASHSYNYYLTEHQASRIARCREDYEAYAFPSPDTAFIGSIGFSLVDLFIRNIFLRDSLFAKAAT
jgi:hypothetical protein